jgi:general secretion pathway protein J
MSHYRYKTIGYTLIEVMIALVVFAVIAAISSSVLYHAFSTRERVAVQANQLGELQLALTLFEHDTVQFVPRTVRSEMTHIFSAFVGAHQYMEFSRGGSVNPKDIAKRSGLKRVAYLCSGKELIRRSWESLDSGDRRRYEDKVLLHNLESCSFKYISKYQQIMPEWSAYTIDKYQKTQMIPAGIELTINPNKWGSMTFLFVIPEGLYAF